MPRAQVPPVTRVRGQWLAASLRAVRERGLLERYMTALPQEHHVAIRSTPVHEWLPADAVVAHYTALDSLELPNDDIVDIGSSTVLRGHGKAIEVVIKVMPLSALSVFTLLSRTATFWDRAFDGGAPAVFKLGPKEVRIDVVGLPFAHLNYPRVAIRGVIGGVLTLLGKTVYVNEYAPLCTGNMLSYRVSWV
jgi:hypothetical protein